MSMDSKKFYILTDEQDKYTKLCELLVQQGWKPIQVDLSSNLASQLDTSKDTNSCFAILSPRAHRFSYTDFSLISELMWAGNSLIVASKADETQANTASNLNQLTSKYGVKFRKNSIIRPNPYKLYHPTEVMLIDFVVNRSFSELIKKHSSSYSNSSDAPSLISNGEPTIKILYANGCSLQVDNDSHVIMTSSNYALPPNQAICSFCKGVNNSRVITIGAVSVFTNTYLECENNKSLMMGFLDICQDKHFSINLSDAKTLELPKMVYTGDMNTLIDLPLPCFKTLKPLPGNKIDLIKKYLFNLDCSRLPLVVDAYNHLEMSNEPLTLLRPRFHCQYLELEPATHGFILRRPKETIH